MHASPKLNTTFNLTKAIIKIFLIAMAVIVAFVTFMHFTPTVAHAINPPTPIPRVPAADTTTNITNTATTNTGNGGKPIDVCGVISTCPTWINDFKSSSNTPESLAKTIFKFILMFVYIAIYLSAAIATLFIVFAGYRYITSQGDEKNTKPALDTLKNAVIGLVLAILSLTIVTFIGNFLTTFNF
jgi:flagellar biosynthesis protein FlhB